MSEPTTPSPRFAAALADLGLTGVEVRAFPDSTRTATEAAAAVGCELSQIVKSLIFEADGEPVLVLMDGASRVDVERVRAELGAATVKRAGAQLVRSATGYAIGGVPPFGHATEMRVLADRGLLAHDTVWSAAGDPHTVFALEPRALVVHARGAVADVREQPAEQQAGQGAGDAGKGAAESAGAGERGGEQAAGAK